VPPTGTSGSVFPDEGLGNGDGLVQDAARTTGDTGRRSDAKPFDQTNGLVDVEGDSDGTALSDTASEAERNGSSERGPGTLPSAGGTSGQH
jgi:hypothetical protein